MNLHINFILFSLIMCVHSKINYKCSLDPLSPCSIGLKFATEVINTSDEDLIVELNPNACCLDHGDENCDIIIITGGDRAGVAKGTSKTLYLIAPLLDPYDRRGHCTFHLDYRSQENRSIKREAVKIRFDTTIKEKNPEGITKCKNVDEDPINDCKPVDCEVFYNGKLPYYSNKLKRCVHAPICVSNLDAEVPTAIYDSISNKCITGKAVTPNDVQFIKSLTEKGRKTKNIMIIENLPPQDFKSQNIKGTNSNENTVTLARFSFIKCLRNNRYTLTVLIIVIMIQCFLICTMIYCLSKSCGCGRKKTVVRKYFNYRQDASVTTPLIGTSNIDTETTDYQYLSESSNIDKKIKCYKACQKERLNNMKLSMSDDILSKCLNRRNWNHLPKSETIPEVNIEEFDNTAVRKHESDCIVKTDLEEHLASKVKAKNEAILNVTSEKEIKCHNYNVTEANNLKGKCFKSADTEKGAQAYFSNDSIDDFLSERGLIYIGENNSKYSFTSVSSDVGSSSSRTSKNNLVKNVMSLFSRKSKSRLSDPGLKKSKGELDLELIHMSHASVCSSSNEYVRDLKKYKDSRSSL